MKGSWTIFILTLVAVVWFSAPAQAATASLSVEPASKSVMVGEAFTVALIANANGEELDTIRAACAYPADLLELSFVALSSLYPNVSPASEYGGGRIYFGGFRLNGPTIENGTFAMLTFRALKEGTATISFEAGSRMLFAGEDRLASTSPGSIVIGPAALPPEAEEAPAAAPSDRAEAGAAPAEPGAPPAAEQVPVEGGVLEIWSATHPDQGEWSSENDVTVSWDAPEGLATGFWIGFDQDPAGEPGQSVSAATREMTYEDVEDGVWYFHLALEYRDGTLSEIAHFRTMIDTTPPRSFETVIRVTADGVFLEFATLDDASGVAYYEVSVDGATPVTAESPYELADDFLVASRHVSVAAYDYAGNGTRAVGETVIVEPEATAVAERFLAWSEEVRAWIRAVTLIIAGAGAFFLILFWRRRKKKEEAEKQAKSIQPPPSL